MIEGPAMDDDVGLTIEGTTITAGAAIAAGVAAAVVETIRGGKGHREELKTEWTRVGEIPLRGMAIRRDLQQNMATRRKRKASEYREICLFFHRLIYSFFISSPEFLLAIPHQRCPDRKGSQLNLMQHQQPRKSRCRTWS